MPATGGVRTASVSFARDYAHAAERVWSVLGDFGNHYWVPAVQHAELIGTGVGAIRRLRIGEGMLVDERLESFDAGSCSFSYSVLGPMPYPVEDYRVEVRVEVLDETSSRVHWLASFRPLGLEPGEAEYMMAGVYEAIGEWLEAEVARRFSPAA